MTKRIDYTRAKELYDQGYGDPTIAKILGCSHIAIYNWRRTTGLPAHYGKYGTKSIKQVELKRVDDPESLLTDESFIKEILHGQ